MKLVRYILLIALTAILVIPFIFMLNNSFKTNQEYIADSLPITTTLTYSNYQRAWTIGGIGNNVVSTVVIVTITVALVTMLSSAAAFGIFRIESVSRLGTVFYIYFIAGIMIPPTTIIIKLFILLKNLGLMNSYSGIIFAYLGAYVSFPIFLMVSFMRTIPRDLIDATEIDGCNPFLTFLLVALPLNRAVISSSIILTTIWLWKEFLYASILLFSNSKITIQVGLQRLYTTLGMDWTALFAGTLLSTLPLILIFVSLRKQFIEGVRAGALKG